MERSQAVELIDEATIQVSDAIERLSTVIREVAGDVVQDDRECEDLLGTCIDGRGRLDGVLQSLMHLVI